MKKVLYPRAQVTRCKTKTFHLTVYKPSPHSQSPNVDHLYKLRYAIVPKFCKDGEHNGVECFGSDSDPVIDYFQI